MIGYVGSNDFSEMSQMSSAQMQARIDEMFRARRAHLEDRYTLECRSCGKLCYHDRRLRAPPPADGYGLCKSCGGSNSTTKPRRAY